MAIRGLTCSVVAAALCLLSSKAQADVEASVLEAGDRIEQAVDTVAEKIDLTLAGKKYTNKVNTSSANISQLVTWSEGGVIRKSTDFGFNLRLPNVERRWQLRFVSYDEEQESRDIQQRRVRTRPRPREYSAGFMFFENLGKIKTSFIPRLQLKNPLEVSYVLRFETGADVAKVHIAPRVDLYADANKGAGQYGSLAFHRDLAKRLELVLQNSEEYRDLDNLFTTQHEVSLEHGLTDTQGVSMALSCGSNNHPQFHLDSETVSVGYGLQIYPERLHFGMTPFLTFVKSRHFKGNAGISGTLDLVF